MEKVRPARQSGIELLRIIAMLMIIAHHFSIHGIFNSWTYNSSLLEVFNSYWSVLLYSFGKVGVDIFIIIMGYFNISKDFKFSKALDIYLKTIFYAFIIYIGALVIGKQVDFIHSCRYWFIQSYLILYLLTPLLNKLILSMPKKISDITFILTLLVGFVLPLFFKHFNLGHVGLFIALYFIGSYYKIRPISLSKNFYITISALTFMFLLVLIFNNISLGVVSITFLKYMSLYSIFTLIFAISLFNYFINLNNFHNDFTNKIAKSVFGVYLLHDNNIVRPFLWNKLLSVSVFMSKTYFIIYSCAVILLVFTTCIFLDKILTRLFGIFKNLLKNLYFRICCKKT